MMTTTLETDVERRPCVLVVDDEPTIREIVAALLEDEGYIVDCAGDGVEALDAVEHTSFDLVLSDVKMPRLDGPALVRQLRRRGYDLPIVLMSAVYADVDLAGLTFVPKPFDSGHLLSRVAAALESGNGHSVAGGGSAGS